jgi:hypothetical protein
MATHTEAQIERVLAVLADAAREECE